MVLDSFLVTTSDTLLSLLRADMALELLKDWAARPAAAMSEPRRLAVCSEAGKLNFLLLWRLLGRSRRFEVAIRGVVVVVGAEQEGESLEFICKNRELNDLITI